MADIFISYSKGFQAQTQELANELRAKGFSVWYDTSLVPGDNFREVIMSELAQARAVIVIWNGSSVKSDWVCSEASRARARRILIPLRSDDIRSHDIPPPFDGLHTELLSNRAAIEASLAKLGVTPTRVPTNVGAQQDSDTAALATAPAISSTTVELRSPERVASERRHLTILASEIVAASGPAGRLDPEEQHEIVDRFRVTCTTRIEQFGGIVAQRRDDGVIAYFGYPTAHEDDAERAVRASLAIRDAVAALMPSPAIQARIGIASGIVVVREGPGPGGAPERSATGSPATLGARLLSLAEPGAVLIAPETWRLVGELFAYRDLGQQSVPGFAEPIRIRQVLGPGSVASRFEAMRRGLGPLVGRQLELEQLKTTLEFCVTAGRGRSVYVRGEAGIGKTRLLHEFLDMARQRGFACHSGWVLDFGAGAGRDAIGALARDLLDVPANGDDDAVRAAMERAFASGLSERGDEVFLNDLLQVPQPISLRAVYDAMDNRTRNEGKRRAIERLVQHASRLRPRLLAVEDVHWADAGTLTYLATLATIVATCPAVLIMTSRFEQDPLDQRWRAQAGTSPLLSIDLAPLHPEDAATLAAPFLSAFADLAKRCVERAGGNPLFLEQLMRNAVEGDSSSVPGSVQSLAQARLDRLGPDDKTALQAASVLGQRFDRDALAYLLDEPDLDANRLLAREMVYAVGDEFLFAHALIHEAVYASLLKSRRGELHRRAADWFARRDATLRASHLDRAGDAATARAYLEAAETQRREYRYEAARGLVTRGLELATDRADRFALSRLLGNIVYELGDMAASRAAFEAALAAAEHDVERCQAWIGSAEVKRVMDDYDGALADLDRAEGVAVACGLKVEEAQLRFLRGNLCFPRGDIEGCLREHSRSLALAREVGAVELEAEALGGLGDAEYMRGRMISASGNFQACIALAARHGLGRIASANRPMAAFTRWFAGEVDAALADSRAAIEAARQVGHKRAEMVAHHAAYFCIRDLADLDGAMEHATQSLIIAQQLRAPRFEAEGLAFQAEVDRLAGRREAAQQRIETALAMSRRTGMAYFGPIILGTMALLSDDERRRRELLDEADALLAAGALSHNHLIYGRDAIEVSLEMADWALAEHYASRLEAHTRAEPLPFSDFFVARGRALAALGRNARGNDHRERLDRLMKDAERLRYLIAMPALRKALVTIEGGGVTPTGD
jgi:class 3 adenylate cyclase/tetratricopeptide (TPR) repeat protein